MQVITECSCFVVERKKIEKNLATCHHHNLIYNNACENNTATPIAIFLRFEIFRFQYCCWYRNIFS